MVVRISIQAAHEQVNPSDLLHDVIYMDHNGIERCWSSDHYMPWWNTGASGGAAWPWLGAALARTNKVTIGTGVTAPILRYNPAIVAQVFATLGFMFPNRVFLGIGRGESLNEVTSGNQWPSNSEKFERLKEAVHLIKKLWTEDWVNFKGKYYWVKDSKLYTKPKTPIPLYIAASYDPNDKQKAIESIRFWRGAMIKAFFDADVHDPRKIEENGQVIGDDTLENMLLVISNGEDAIKKLQKYVKLGFTEIVLTNSSPNRDKLVKIIAEEIAPSFKNYNNRSSD